MNVGNSTVPDSNLSVLYEMHLSMMITITISMNETTSRITKLLLGGVLALLILLGMYVVGNRVLPIVEGVPKLYQHLIVIAIIVVNFILYMGGAFLSETRFIGRKY